MSRARWFAASLAFGAALAPVATRAGPAFDDLCRAAGTCNVNVPEPPPPTRVDGPSSKSQRQTTAPRETSAPKPRAPTQAQQINAMVAGTLIQGFLSGLLAPSSSGQDAAAAEAERQRQVELLRQRTEQVRGQREQRERENTENLEEMRSALAEPFDAGATPVRLEGGTVGLFAPPENPFAKPRPARAPSAAAERLAAKAAENADVARLQARLADLEGKAGDLRARALDLKRSSNALVREYQDHEEAVARTVDEAKERGTSMAFEGLLKLDTKALSALEEVRSNKSAWNTMVAALRSGDTAARTALDARETMDTGLADLRQLAQNRDLKQDLQYLGSRLGGPYYEYGSSIVESAVAIRTQLQTMRSLREMKGIDASYRAELGEVSRQLAELQRPLRDTREALARKIGVPVAELPRAPIPEAPPVPHPLD